MFVLHLDAKWQVLIIICMGIFMSTLDGSILNIANPSIARDFSVSMSEVQWVVTSYMLVITSSLLFFGRMGDKIGCEKIYTRGFLVFSIGSLICSISSSLFFLIFARVIQAFGASMMMATGIGIISNTFPSKERGKALGLTGSIVGIGNMTGPSLGGLLVAHFSWPVIFLINVPIGIIGFLIANKYLPSQPKDEAVSGYDTVGIGLFALSAITMIISLTKSNGIDIPVFMVSLFLVLIFWLFEENTLYPMLDFSLFRSNIFLQGNLMAAAVYSTQMSVFFLMPFYMEKVFHMSPDQCGLFMTIPPVTMAIIAPLAGSLSDKLGSTRIIPASLSMLTLAYLIFSSLGSNLNTLKIIGGLIALGTGMGMFGSPNNSMIFGALPREKAGYAGGFVSTVRNLCFSLGIAFSVSIFTFLFTINQKDASFANAYTNASSLVYKIAAIITLLALIFYLVNTKITSNRTFGRDISG
jgi:EmrB/QacA subfamily drug resistance transporter